ncbi:hypothetical protein BZA05DRAFT_102254 [Tricharina praecox]|uniref:uncharacterized protein n=1 Tax=Tricharina praecox TaxID=43433 RepID=UPI00221EB132|nr:uncharacterized protein BZA05DRAFT_102254 [Tricharina praecox]KAI5857661.1 hypothetical protein BZA05DRAFT_102254 [Tricharina praecox]
MAGAIHLFGKPNDGEQYICTPVQILCTVYTSLPNVFWLQLDHIGYLLMELLGTAIIGTHSSESGRRSRPSPSGSSIIARPPFLSEHNHYHPPPQPNPHSFLGFHSSFPTDTSHKKSPFPLKLDSQSRSPLSGYSSATCLTESELYSRVLPSSSLYSLPAPADKPLTNHYFHPPKPYPPPPLKNPMIRSPTTTITTSTYLPPTS